MRGRRHQTVYVLLSFCLTGLHFECKQAIAALIVLNGNEGRVDVGEDGGTGEIKYLLNVLNGTDQIFGFAVSNNTSAPTGAFTTSTTFAGWSSKVVPRTSTMPNSAWDDDIAIDQNISTADLGTFESLFGTDTVAFVYYKSDLSGVLIDETNDQDVFDPPQSPLDPLQTDPNRFKVNISGPASEFVAFTSSGAIIDRSLAAVPEPSSCMLLALSSLVALRRPRRQHHTLRRRRKRTLAARATG